MNWLKLTYNRVIGNRFFYKLLLQYSAIIIITVSIMVVIIVSVVSAMLREQAMNYNQQVLESVNNYFYNQNRSLKSIVTNVYTADWENNTQIITTIQDLFDSEALTQTNSSFNNQIISTRILNDYLQNYALLADPDIKDIVLVKPDFDFYLYASRNNSANFVLLDYFSQITTYIAGQKVDNINAQRDYIIPAFQATRNKSSINMYCIYDFIRQSGNSSNPVGYIVAAYNPDSIRNSYRQFNKYLIGDILILREDGSVIFDSSGERYGQTVPELALIRSSAGQPVQDRDSVINVIRNSEFGFYTVGIISKDDLYRSMNSLNWLIIVTMLACSILILMLTFLSTRKFNARVKDINETLSEIQKGNFNARAIVKGTNDEIEQISANINLMSERLNDHIKKEYVATLKRTEAELKQKTAELYSLQSQIDPHFLYNTLEAIRMRALSTGDSNVSDMIKILAKLFRSSTKNDIAVTVKEELSYCESYLELYNIRFNDRLRVHYDIDPQILNCAIIKHLLQPIIENSIVHGINLNRDDNIITIRGELAGGYIKITVQDNGRGIDPATLDAINGRLGMHQSDNMENIGIYNVNTRAKLIFGDDCGLMIASESGLGTLVTLTLLPLTKEALLGYVQSIGG